MLHQEEAYLHYLGASCRSRKSVVARSTVFYRHSTFSSTTLLCYEPNKENANHSESSIWLSVNFRFDITIYIN